jgi:hypothetical protein
MVIELFELNTVDLEASCETANLRIAFEYRSSDAVFSEFVGCCETAETGADDYNMW